MNRAGEALTLLFLSGRVFANYDSQHCLCLMCQVSVHGSLRIVVQCFLMTCAQSAVQCCCMCYCSVSVFSAVHAYLSMHQRIDSFQLLISEAFSKAC